MGRSKNSRRLAWSLVAALGIAALTPAARACPFCTALRPTLAQRRQSSRVVALGEAESPKAKDAKSRRFRVHQVLKGQRLLSTEDRPTLSVDLPDSALPLVILMGSGPAKSPLEELRWSATPVDELSYAYFARAPSLRRPTPERLAYFARYLEHRNELIAQDAYQEFAHASYDEVARVAGKLSAAKLREWLLDESVRQERKGFYGLALGVVAEPDGVAEPEGAKITNAEFLKRLIVKPADDFRAGFDGVLAGYLMSRGAEAVELIRKRYLANAKAAVGDVRHATAALRFYHQYGPKKHRRLIAIAMRELIARPALAATAITDLARWKDWDSLARMAPLYRREAYAEADTRCAIIGYLLVCPKPAATKALEELRRFDPAGVAAAEKQLAVQGVTDR